MVESMGCRVVPESNHAQESHTCLFFFRLFFRPLQDHGFVEIQKFSTMATWRNAAAAFLRLDSAKLRVQTTQDTRRCVSSPRSEVDIMYFPYWFFEIWGSLHTHLFAESIDCFLYVGVIHFFHIPDNWNNKTLQRGKRPFFQQNRRQICTYKIDTNSNRPLKITKRWSSRNSEFWKEYSC